MAVAGDANGDNHVAGPDDTPGLELLALKARLRALPNAARKDLLLESAALARGYRELVANAPRRTRAYFSASRSGEAPADPTGRRREERLAMAWFNAGALKLADGDPVSLLDYQFPLKAAAGDKGIGKVDLLGYRAADNALTVIELKVTGNIEDRRIGLVESLIYAAIVEANADPILREVEARRGHRISGVRPRIMLVAPREFWRSGHPPCETLGSLAAGTAALLETDIRLLAFDEISASPGLDGSRPVMVGETLLSPAF